jgi:ribosomal protein S18 acetylase RimI-like enzyme
MSAPALSSEHRPVSSAANVGLRQANLPKDLGAIADLIEIAFASSMDSSGRAAVREMRSLGRSGPLIWALASLDRTIRSLSYGYVWIDSASGELVGNVSSYPSDYDPNVWIIANVAVHPNFRRQGIARKMMEAAMESAVQRQAREIILQVEERNTGAQRLYGQLGFHALRGFTHWRRRTYRDLPDIEPNLEKITLRQGREWKAELALAQQIRPNERGGLGWQRPTEEQTFRPGILARLNRFILGRNITRWVMRSDEDERLLASAPVETRFGSTYARVDLLVSPEQQGQLEKPLLNFVIRHLAERRHGILIHHPSDDEAANRIFEEYDFEHLRSLVHMRWLASSA